MHAQTFLAQCLLAGVALTGLLSATTWHAQCSFILTTETAVH